MSCVIVIWCDWLSWELIEFAISGEKLRHMRTVPRQENRLKDTEWVRTRLVRVERYYWQFVSFHCTPSTPPPLPTLFSAISSGHFHFRWPFSGRLWAKNGTAHSAPAVHSNPNVQFSEDLQGRQLPIAHLLAAWMCVRVSKLSNQIKLNTNHCHYHRN